MTAARLNATKHLLKYNTRSRKLPKYFCRIFILSAKIRLFMFNLLLGRFSSLFMFILFLLITTICHISWLHSVPIIFYCSFHYHYYYFAFRVFLFSSSCPTNTHQDTLLMKKKLIMKQRPLTYLRWCLGCWVCCLRERRPICPVKRRNFQLQRGLLNMRFLWPFRNRTTNVQLQLQRWKLN